MSPREPMPGRAGALALAVAALACATAGGGPREARVLSVAPAIRAGFEDHRDVPLCRDFTLSPHEVRVFLREARVVNAMEANEAFDWAPCVVRGEAESASGRLAFEITAGLVGTLRFADGRTVLLGCDGRCAAALEPGGPAAPE